MNRKYLLLCAIILTINTSGCTYIPTEHVSYGVYYNDMNLSNTPKDELKNRITELFNATSHTVTIDIGQTSKQASYNDLGINVDTETLVKAISTYGYEDDLWTLINHRFHALYYGQHFEIQYKLDEVKSRTYLSELAKTIDTPGHDAYLSVEGGQVVMHPGKEGKRIDIDATLQQIKDNIAAGNTITHIDMVYTTKNTIKVTDQDIKPLTAVLASYTTNYDANNTSRTHNIQLASDKINGTLLKPGEVFSFNKIVGERTPEAGYDDAPVMINGKLVPGVGGGICQVSSTIFNTALLSGMTIVERTPHFEPVGYIPAGRDATVAWGYLDFQFKNPYQQSVYIISVIGRGTLTIYIIGTPQDKPKDVSIYVGDRKEIPNKTINKVDPSIKENQTQEGHVGLSMNTYRQITYGNGVSQTDVYESVYDPVDTIITTRSAQSVKKH